MRHIDPSTIPHEESHRYLLAGVAPRPIAFVGTASADGVPNLSPFSFFNAFGANPPVIAFSPAYRGTDGAPKHTFLNIKATGEFTVSIVTYSMIGQVSLASSNFAEGVDEWVKSGFTKLPSHRIAPPGVLESPMVMECRLLHHIDLGGRPASGNLMIGEVVMFHIKESAFNGKYLDAERLDLVARMGGPFYCRATGSAIFALPKPTGIGVGFDGLPDDVRLSPWLTGNELARLAGSSRLPTTEAVTSYWDHVRERAIHEADDLDIEVRIANAERMEEIAVRMARDGNRDGEREWRHRAASAHLRADDLERAWLCVGGIAG